MFLLFSIGLKDTMARVRSTITVVDVFSESIPIQMEQLIALSVVGVNRSSIMKRKRAKRKAKRDKTNRKGKEKRSKAQKR